MSLKQIMGSAYKEDMTLQEVEAFFEGNSKIVNLSDGKYVAKEKFDDVNTKYQTLQNDTKDFEDIKNKYQELIAKQTKDNELGIINKYVKPEFANYVHYQLSEKKLLNDKLEDNVKAFIKENSQFKIDKTPMQPKKIINTISDMDGESAPKNSNPNSALNNMIRAAAGKQVEVE